MLDNSGERETDPPCSAAGVGWAAAAAGRMLSPGHSLQHHHQHHALPPPHGHLQASLSHHAQQQQLLAYQHLAALAGYHGGSLPLGIPGGSKPLVPVPGSPHAGMGKLPPKTATVPPLNHHSSSNNSSSGGVGGSNGSTMRTQGFAAALRKLAHQAKDSADEPGLKQQQSSPPDSHIPRDLTSKARGQGSSSQMSFPAWPLSSVPVVTIAPTQAHPAHNHHHLDGSRSYDRAPVSSNRSSSSSGDPQPHHNAHHHQSPQLQQQQQQHHHPHHHHHHQGTIPSSKPDNREMNHQHSSSSSSRHTPPASHGREEDWSKEGRGSRSSLRITPQAPTSSPPSSSSASIGSLTSQALTGHTLSREALDAYARGLHGYGRPEEEALRLGLAAGLPYGVDPTAYAAYAAAAAAAYHPAALLQQQAALAAHTGHSPYRLDDPLLLERYRLLQASSPYLPPFPGLAGLSSLAGLGLHPALAGPHGHAPAHLPPELLQRYPHAYLGAAAGAEAGGQPHHHPLLDPLLDPRLAAAAAAQAALVDRSRLEEQKARETRESERGREDRRKESEGSSRARDQREPGEREHHSRSLSYDSHSGTTSDVSSGQDLSHHQRSLSELRDGRGGQMPHPVRARSPVSDNKRNSIDHMYRESRGSHESLRDSHSGLEMSRDSHNSGTRPRQHTSNTYVVKPYEKTVDQQLSQGEPPSTARPHTSHHHHHHHHHHQDAQHDRESRPLASPGSHSTRVEGQRTPVVDGPKPSMLSPLIQRPWSSASLASSSSHHNHHQQQHPHHHQSSASAATPPRKDRPGSDFFRPFDDPVDNTDSNRDKSKKQESESRRGFEKRPEGASSISSLPSPQHYYHQRTLPGSSSSQHPHHTPPFSANILSIPSVKVHPQHWSASANEPHSDPSKRSTMSPLTASPSSSLSIPPPPLSSSSERAGLPPPLIPTLQPAGVVSEIRMSTDKTVANVPPFQPAISRYITDRIERFDFKSLAQECTGSVPSTSEPTTSADPLSSTLKRPVSQLDQREAAFTLRRRKRRAGVDTGSLTSFILSEEECGDEEEESMMTRLTMLSRVSPIPLYADAAKLDLLQYLGLTTHKRRRELEVKKERRRRRKLRMASVSPVRPNVDSTETFIGSPTPLSQAEGQQDSSPWDESTQKDDSQKKAGFLTSLGLKPLSQYQKAELCGRRKLVVQFRRKNGLRRLTAKKCPSKSSSSSSISKTTTSSATAATPDFSSLVGIPSQQQHYLISAGLATEVRPLQAAAQEKARGVEERRGQGVDLKAKHAVGEKQGPPPLTNPMSQILGSQYSYMPKHEVLSLPGHPFSSTGTLPLPPNSRPPQPPRGDEAAASMAAPPSHLGLGVPSSNLPYPQHLLSSRASVPTAAVSGQSHAVDTGSGAESRYQVLQASQQDLEEAARRMDRHLAMWTDKLAQADRRNATTDNSRGNSSSQS